MQKADNRTVSPEHEEFIAAIARKAESLGPGESTKVGAPMSEDALRTILHGVGLHRVLPWHPDEPKDGYSYLQAHKPDLSPVRGVMAIMSLPRYGLCSNFGAVTRALLPLGIKLEQGFGVYWSEVMTRMMSSLVDRDTQYILTIDYDSVFDASDVLTLIRLLEQTPDAGAICGVQMRRTKPTALLTMKDGAAQVPIETFQQELTEVRSAHFGLTVIRAEALRKLSKPWFQAVPDSNGEWSGDDYVAADVNFWLKFADEGHKLYQANTVAIGHIAEVVIWPDRFLRPVIQHTDDYMANGVPDEALR